MKTHALFALALVALMGCSTAKPANKKSSTAAPETVFVTYHVQPGKEAELEKVLARAWVIYRKEGLVFAQPHVIVRDSANGPPRMVEIFTWVSHAAPEHAPASVKAIWNEMQSLCEARDGHGGLDGGEVDLILPKAK